MAFLKTNTNMSMSFIKSPKEKIYYRKIKLLIIGLHGWYRFGICKNYYMIKNPRSQGLLQFGINLVVHNFKKCMTIQNSQKKFR